ncbi:hypothetical protein [Actinomycetospora sp. CA-084318]|uniref:hypothetical protein n=1 Tax=Actinomycetospora sp. CA-084318 TaxID=3239892 RepID=UPI003D97445D
MLLDSTESWIMMSVARGWTVSERFEGQGADEGEEVVAWAEDGRLLIAGEVASVDEFIRDLAPERELDLGALRALREGVNSLDVPAGAKSAKRYVELSAERWKEISTPAATRGELRYVTRDVTSGRFVSNTSVARTAAATQPEVLIALAAIEMALESIAATVEEIAKNVDDLKRHTEAAEPGNLAGLYRVLANARTQVNHTGTISRTTWESIATHEVTAQQSADRVRQYLRGVLRDLPLAEGSNDRLQAADRLVEEGTLQRNLRLLVLAEQCRLLWRSLKLDQVRVAEPEALEMEAEAAKALLSENALADRELIVEVTAAIKTLTRVAPLDGVRFGTRSRLPGRGGELYAAVDEFARARAQQLEAWAPESSPGLRDAAREVGRRAGRAALGGRQAVGGWITQVGSWVEGAAPDGPTPTGKHARKTNRSDP